MKLTWKGLLKRWVRGSYPLDADVSRVVAHPDPEPARTKKSAQRISTALHEWQEVFFVVALQGLAVTVLSLVLARS
jgi:hypothetical protein